MSSALCKEPIPKIGNKYSQKRNCMAIGQCPNFHIHASVCAITIDLSILLRETWGVGTDSGNTIAHKHMNVMCNLGLKPRNSQKRNT
jgi:hypothetical protein